MTRLQEQLKYFVVNKMSTDRLWHGVRVYLSGHEVSCLYSLVAVSCSCPCSLEDDKVNAPQEWVLWDLI